METQCIQEQMVFQQLGAREVIGRFDGGTISSDAGGVLLREVENHFGILKRVAGCFRDYRDPERIRAQRGGTDQAADLRAGAGL